MPVYIASGSFTDDTSGVKYRFLVLPRYDIDLQKIISRGRTLELKNILVLAVQILDVLEYLHKQGYTHSDIKSSNLMLGFDGSRNCGMVCKDIVTSSNQRRTKRGKSRASNYYQDEDFVFNSKPNRSPTAEEKFAATKHKFKNVLKDKTKRSLVRHHAFNLRQLAHDVNYEDFNSLVSDESYQKLLKDDDKKQLVYSSDEGFHSETSRNSRSKAKTVTNESPLNSDDANPKETFREAIVSQSDGQIYLLDYGLASKFLDSDGNHKDFGMDARKAHDGTLEYSSRDSHIGAHSRRSDLETLAFNLLDWLTGTLPWKTTEMLAEPDLVHALKKNFMSDVGSLLKTCFKTDNYPQFLEKYLQYVTNLDFTEKPDYDYCRSIFRKEFVRNGFGTEKDMLLNFAQPSVPPVNRKNICYSKSLEGRNKPVSRGINTLETENICTLESNLKLELLRQTLNSSSDGTRKPCTSRNFFISDADLIARLKKSLMPHEMFGKKLSPKNLRSNNTKVKKRCGKRKHRSSIGKFGNFMGSARQFTWAEILAGNPEDIIRKDRNTVAENEDEDEDTCKYRIRKLSDASEISNDSLQSPLMHKDYLHGTNPTYAMKEVLANFRCKVAGKLNKDEDRDEKFKGYTPIMIKLFKVKVKREARELLESRQNDKNKNKIDKDINKCKIVEKRCTRSAANVAAASETSKAKQTSSRKKYPKRAIKASTDKIVKQEMNTISSDKNKSVSKKPTAKSSKKTQSSRNKSNNTKVSEAPKNAKVDAKNKPSKYNFFL